MSAEQIKSGSRIVSENEALKQALKTPVLEGSRAQNPQSWNLGSVSGQKPSA